MDIEEVEKKIIAFRNERNWKQFHQIKDLLLALYCGPHCQDNSIKK